MSRLFDSVRGDVNRVRHRRIHLEALDAEAWQRTAVNGALFGFFRYATYDLTNFAKPKGRPVPIVVANLAGGAFVSAVGATAGFITRLVFR